MFPNRSRCLGSVHRSYSCQEGWQAEPHGHCSWDASSWPGQEVLVDGQSKRRKQVPDGHSVIALFIFRIRVQKILPAHRMSSWPTWVLCTLGSLLANWLPYRPIWWLLHTSDILLAQLTSSWSDYNISKVSLTHLMSYLLIWCPAILFDIFTGLSVDPLFHLCPACLFKFYLPFFENVLILFPWPVFTEATDKAHHYLGVHISVVIPSSPSVSV